MTRKNIAAAIFLAVVTVLAASALATGNFFAGRRADGVAAIAAFKPDEVRKITISWRTRKATMILKDGKWLLLERGMRPASVPRISTLLNALSGLRPMKQIDNVDDNVLKALRLYNGDPKILPGVTVELSDAHGHEIFNITLGKGHFAGGSSDLPETRTPEGRYVMSGGKVWLVSAIFEYCHPIPEVWLEHLRINSLAKALFMSVHMRKKDSGAFEPLWIASRARTSVGFDLIYPSGKKIDRKQLGEAAEILSRPFSFDIATDEKAKDFKYDLSFTMRDSEGFAYHLKLAQSGKRTRGTMSVAFDPKAIAPHPGENALMFEKRKGMLSVKYGFEKRYFDGNVFLINPELTAVLKTVPSLADAKASEKRSRAKHPAAVGSKRRN